MELEISIKEASIGLKDKKVTERKKHAEILKGFLTRNAVPSLLSENTLKKRGYTWNNLFDDINEYILKVTIAAGISVTHSHCLIFLFFYFHILPVYNYQL